MAEFDCAEEKEIVHIDLLRQRPDDVFGEDTRRFTARRNSHKGFVERRRLRLTESNARRWTNITQCAIGKSVTIVAAILIARQRFQAPNVGETSWKFTNYSLCTVADIFDGGPHAFITVISTINGVNDQFPAKGRKARGESRCRTHCDDTLTRDKLPVAHQSSDLTTREVARTDQELLRTRRAGRISRLRNCDMAHRDREPQQHTRSRNIRLVVVPPGITGQVRPFEKRTRAVQSAPIEI
jgi:hypothetical protein